MPQIIIKPRTSDGGEKSVDSSINSQILVIVTDSQIEIYTAQDAQEKLSSEQ